MLLTTSEPFGGWSCHQGVRQEAQQTTSEMTRNLEIVSWNINAARIAFRIAINKFGSSCGPAEMVAELWRRLGETKAIAAAAAAAADFLPIFHGNLPDELLPFQSVPALIFLILSFCCCFCCSVMMMVPGNGVAETPFSWNGSHPFRWVFSRFPSFGDAVECRPIPMQIPAFPVPPDFIWFLPFHPVSTGFNWFPLVSDGCSRSNRFASFPIRKLTIFPSGAVNFEPPYVKSQNW